MAESETKVKAVVEAQDKTGDVFKNIGSKMKELETSSGNLQNALTKLGIVGAAIFIAYKTFEFFKEGTKAAGEQAQATRLLIAGVENLGIVYNKVGGKIDDYIKKMFRLGQEDTETAKGLTQLLRVTKDVNGAMVLSTVASDLAASGIHTYTENVDMLQRILLGKGIRALTEYGIVVKENATVGEQLAAVQGLISRTAVQMADDVDGQQKRMKASWDEFQENMGSLGTWLSDVFARGVNGIFSKLADDSGGWAKTIAGAWMKAGYSIGIIWDNIKTGKFKEAFNELTMGAGAEAKFETYWKAVTGSTSGIKSDKENTADFLKLLANMFQNVGTTASKTADKLKDAFTNFSKNIVQAFNDQEKAINELHSSINELDDALNDSLKKSEEKYQEDVKNLARKAADRMVEIDKEIANEKSAMSQGWRTRIEELNAEKAKEQAVIDRAGGEVANLAEETAKNELTILQEKHNKEIEEIVKQNNEKKKLLEDEIKAREDYLAKIKGSVTAPGFYSNVTTEGVSFMGAVGAAPSQQSLVFNFNAGVAGDAGIKKLIQDTIAELNRQATLKGISGK